jgi:hypothetical protein
MDNGYTKEEWTWLAGFVDARGMLGTSRGRPRMVLRHNDFDTLAKIGEMLDVNVRGPFRDNFPDRTNVPKPHWIIQISAYGKLVELYDKIGPYLSEKRQEDYRLALAAGQPKRLAKITEFDVDNCGRYEQPVPSQGGYRRHLRRGEPSCRVCLESNRLYDQQYRERSR